MTRLALTTLATAAAYVIGWKSASAWWGRCATECRRGASNGAGPVSLGAPTVPGPQNGAELPIHRTEAGWPRCSTCDGGGCYDCTEPA